MLIQNQSCLSSACWQALASSVIVLPGIGIIFTSFHRRASACSSIGLVTGLYPCKLSSLNFSCQNYTACLDTTPEVTNRTLQPVFTFQHYVITATHLGDSNAWITAAFLGLCKSWCLDDILFWLQATDPLHYDKMMIML